MVCLRASIWLLAMGAVLAAVASPVFAQKPLPANQELQPLIPAENHPWARFRVGSWSQTRITSESFDSRGVATTTVEEVKSILKVATLKSYTLTVERTVEVGGSRVSTQSREKKFGLSGESDEQTVISMQPLGDSELDLNGRKIPCEVRQAVVNGEGTQRTTVKVHYSPDVTPHALRREWVVAPTADSAATATTIEKVIAIGLPFRVLEDTRAAAFVHTVQKVAGQSKETMEVTCSDVPGGIVAQWSKSLDANGKLIGRTTLELVGYHIEVPRVATPAPAPTRTKMMDRRRGRRGEEKMGSRREP